MLTGTTASLVVLIDGRFLVSAHVGDSAAMLAGLPMPVCSVRPLTGAEPEYVKPPPDPETGEPAARISPLTSGAVTPLASSSSSTPLSLHYHQHLFHLRPLLPPPVCALPPHTGHVLSLSVCVSSSSSSNEQGGEIETSKWRTGDTGGRARRTTMTLPKTTSTRLMTMMVTMTT